MFTLLLGDRDAKKSITDPSLWIEGVLLSPIVIQSNTRQTLMSVSLGMQKREVSTFLLECSVAL